MSFSNTVLSLLTYKGFPYSRVLDTSNYDLSNSLLPNNNSKTILENNIQRGLNNV